MISEGLIQELIEFLAARIETPPYVIEFYTKSGVVLKSVELPDLVFVRSGSQWYARDTVEVEYEHKLWKSARVAIRLLANGHVISSQKFRYLAQDDKLSLHFEAGVPIFGLTFNLPQ